MPRATNIVYEKLLVELVDIVTLAHQDGVEIAGWLADGLGRVAMTLPDRTESLLEQRPGSWEADFVRNLVNGTIGWEGDEDHHPAGKAYLESGGRA
ncbi:MAG TPA: hypothetical protein VGJ25_09020 [Gaiellaceae bacterium]|jgi:hypothetical protein